jgi:hypothetical protein
MYLEDYGISFMWSSHQTKTLQEMAKVMSEHKYHEYRIASYIYCCWNSKTIGTWLFKNKRGKWSIEKSVSGTSSKEINILQRSNYNVVREGQYYVVRGKR